ncbi:MAG: tRNA pseudouridine(55) synthase TruB, partial [Gemmatimonadota bacterium]
LSVSESTLTARIQCSRGTYIRALARDLGRMTNSAAHLSALRREASGPFHVRDAVTFETLEQGDGLIAVRPLVSAIPSIPRVALNAEDEARVRHGAHLDIGAGQRADEQDERAALVDSAGRLIALARRDGDRWHPDVVLIRN